MSTGRLSRYFRTVCYWLYCDNVLVLKRPFCSRYCKLFAFAERCVIAKLADETMDTMTKAPKDGNVLPTAADMAMTYLITPKNSKLRLLMSCTFVYITLLYDETVADGTWQDEKMHTIAKENEDLLLDALVLLRKQTHKAADVPI